MKHSPTKYVLLASAVLGLLASACAPSTPVVRATTLAPATLMTAPDAFADLGNVTVRYRQIGSGDPVILLHGYAGSLEMWSNLADSLAGSYRVIATDVRGFGQSTKSGDPSRYGRPMVQDVFHLMDRLGLSRAHLVGHSMGAVIAANAALSSPSRVSSVTLLAGPFYTDSASFAAEIRPFLEDLEARRTMRPFLAWLFPMWSDSMVAAISTQLLTQNDFGSMVAVFRALPALTVTERVASTARVPALAIVGTADPLLDESQWFAARWPQARIITLPDVNHLAIIFRPDLPSQIREFLPR